MHRLPIVVFLAVVLMAPLAAQVKVTQQADRITVDIQGQPFTEFIVRGHDVYKPYFYPIRSPSGKVVTRHYPMEVVEGESHDHPHHRGLWFAHGDVNGVDLWSADPAAKNPNIGRIVLKKVLEAKSGKQEGLIVADFAWNDKEGNEIVSEHRTVRIYNSKEPRIMDFNLVLTAVKKAHFGDTKEGTFAIRLTDSMDEQHGGTIVNGKGVTGEKNLWGKRAPWLDYYGKVKGETVGVAIFDHPSNPRHPTYWHVRAYGLFGANIFGLHNFYHDNTRDGSLTLDPGHTLKFRYRVLIHSGDVKQGNVAKQYSDWILSE